MQLVYCRNLQGMRLLVVFACLVCSSMGFMSRVKSSRVATEVAAGGRNAVEADGESLRTASVCGP